MKAGYSCQALAAETGGSKETDTAIRSGHSRHLDGGLSPSIPAQFGTVQGLVFGDVRIAASLPAYQNGSSGLWMQKVEHSWIRDLKPIASVTRFCAWRYAFVVPDLLA